MKLPVEILNNSPLFDGMVEKEALSVLSCLNAFELPYKKDEFILRDGDRNRSVCLVVSGCVHILKEDYWGNRSILAQAEPGQIFGEAYACVEAEEMAVSAVAARDSEVLFLDVHRVLTVCSSACAFHSRLIRNLLSILAEKNLLLTRKMDHITKRTIREKLLSYLSLEARRAGGPSFEIPFNRQQLADYLSVDRSALSYELSRMQKDGLLQYSRNRFSLL